MTLRYTLSQLSRGEARRAFGLWWLGICVVGFLASLLVFGGRHAFFLATVWFLFLFLPVRIAAETLHTLGPRIRRQMQLDLERQPDRYTTREHISLRIEVLFRREVQLPRIAPPEVGAKVMEAAVGLTGRALREGDGPLGVLRTTAVCGTLLDRWLGTIASGEGGAVPGIWDPRASIQEQWVTLRALAALAALTKTLTAVYEDSAGRPLDGGPALRAAADAAMDYADQVGLKLDGPAWEEVSGIPRTALSSEHVARLAETWTAFCKAPPPAPRRLLDFLETVVAS